MKKLSPTDLKRLKQLWEYLQYASVFGLVDGLSKGKVEVKFIHHLEKYGELRQNPEFQFENGSLDAVLRKFDSLLEKTLEESSCVFEPTPTTGTITKTLDWYLLGVSRGSEDYKLHVKQCEILIKKFVKPTWNQYKAFITYLKKSGIYQQMGYEDNWESSDQELKISGEFRLQRFVKWGIFITSACYSIVKLVLSIIWLISEENIEGRIEAAVNLLDIGILALTALSAALSAYILNKDGEFAYLLNFIKNDGEKTRKIISNSNSVNHGLELLRSGKWSTGNQKIFYCDSNTAWTITTENIDEEFVETWINNIPRPDNKIKRFDVALKFNNTEVKRVAFVSLDGHRIRIPIPHKDRYSGNFYYCENSLEHLLFNRIKSSFFDPAKELKELAKDAEIDWRKCQGTKGN